MKAKTEIVVKKRVSKFDAYRAIVQGFVAALRSRRVVGHSSTPNSKTDAGVTKQTVIPISELITVVITADKLGKDVVLKAYGDKNLVVTLVDRVPEIPWQL